MMRSAFRSGEDSEAVIRAAVRAELNELFAEGGRLQALMRKELAGARRKPSHRSSGGDRGEEQANGREHSRELRFGEEDPADQVIDIDKDVTVCDNGKAKVENARDGDGQGRGYFRHDPEESGTIRRTSTSVADPFSKFLTQVTRQGLDGIEQADGGLLSYLGTLDGCVSAVVRWWYKQYSWFSRLEEPKRKGILAGIVQSDAFASTVCFIIMVNSVFMIFATNQALQNPGERNSTLEIIDWCFLVFYTVELILKLLVNHLFFFCNEHWRANVFDLILVMSGYMTLAGGSSAMFLRILRLLKLGRVMRLVDVMWSMRHLRAFIVCLQGSLSIFVWSMVMLSMVLFVFALIMTQQIAVYMEETGTTLSEAPEAIDTFFSSVFVAMETLFSASTGGIDWQDGYAALKEVGWHGRVSYLAFVAFVQLAVININTGIFVNAAMVALAPNKETVALDHHRQEQQTAQELRRLCALMDVDHSGKLTTDQFEEGLQKGRLLLLFNMLGLSHDNVNQLFSTMSELAALDDGQVPIADLVAACMRLKGYASNFDLQMLCADSKNIQTAMEQGLADIRVQVEKLQEMVLQETVMEEA